MHLQTRIHALSVYAPSIHIAHKISVEALASTCCDFHLLYTSSLVCRINTFFNTLGSSDNHVLGERSLLLCSKYIFFQPYCIFHANGISQGNHVGMSICHFGATYGFR
ncbi:hypothetical protein GDO81_004966 [Engystomops pustulosus]|uniref:Uncharacterized protein n=1 Tax=Engystomops pustulosus TaxID=76066 RepID=A0AAV7CJQ8_ENGPU|nr:hypothetical protein GDO81_004966 [Engystomops pustulosus]